MFAIIVGSKDGSGAVKYGIISEKEEILTPIIYDKIEYSLDEQYSAGQSVKTAKDFLLRRGLWVPCCGYNPLLRQPRTA
ncbi:MAG: hypothetical protein EOO20_29220 [Chryseobacterium sp.]|nr:MAG: hypothetical protein EOO20_29220 [Chryseobacterium sp.]